MTIKLLSCFAVIFWIPDRVGNDKLTLIMALEAVLCTYLLIITNRVLSHGKKIVKELSKIRTRAIMKIYIHYCRVKDFY